jgi:hypothetical protein
MVGNNDGGLQAFPVNIILTEKKFIQKKNKKAFIVSDLEKKENVL